MIIGACKYWQTLLTRKSYIGEVSVRYRSAPTMLIYWVASLDPKGTSSKVDIFTSWQRSANRFTTRYGKPCWQSLSIKIRPSTISRIKKNLHLLHTYLVSNNLFSLVLRVYLYTWAFTWKHKEYLCKWRENTTLINWRSPRGPHEDQKAKTKFQNKG